MVSTSDKNNVLLGLATLLQQNIPQIIDANIQDIETYSGDDESMIDRLRVNESKIYSMIQSLKDVAILENPEGKILYDFTRSDGLIVQNRSVPFGSILIIYESRPDVTIEASATAFKAGNKILLKGGKEARLTNIFLTKLWQQSLKQNGVSESYIQYLDFSHIETQKLIRNNTHNVDLIIPRGGDSLINFVRQNTNIPLIISGRGNNFLFVDKECDFGMAIKIIINGKSRISVCNALDKVLIDEKLPNFSEQLSNLVFKLKEKGIYILGDENICRFNESIILNDNKNVLDEEFLAPKIYLRSVENIETAIDIINRHSGKHSATIVTDKQHQAELFMQQVDCSAVYHNASTRFTDGGQFGVGAEIAISTQKLHFRGPLGTSELVTNKWFVFGDGQVRE